MKNWEKETIEKLKKLPGKISFYYRSLDSEDTAEYQADQPLLAASVIKLFVMTEAFARIEAGKLDPDAMVTVKREDCVPSCGALNYMHDNVQVTVMDLITLMIILSDNTATNVMIDLLGIDAINVQIRSLGFEKTVLKRKMFDSEKAAQGLENYISAKEAGLLLEKMYRGTLISEKASAKMIEILKTDANILMGKEGDDAEKRKQFEEVFYRIQKMEWKEQKIIMQTIDSLIESFNEYR